MKTLSNPSRLAIAAVLLVSTAVAVAGQNGGPRDDRFGHRGPPSAEMRVARMTEMLDLSDEQSAQLLAVMQETDRERDALHDQVMEQMKPQFCELQLRTESEVANILTPEQLALMEEQKEARAGKGPGRFGPGPGLDCSDFE